MASLGSLSPAVSARDRAWLEARAWLAVGDAHRLVFDLVAAEEALANAAVLLVDPEAPSELRAELAWMRSGLRRYQRRLPEALAFADEAVDLCPAQGGARVMALLMRGQVWSSLGESAQAANDCRAAVEELGPAAEPYCRLSAVQNLALALMECGCVEEARKYLAEAKALVAAMGQPEPRWHVQWVEGLLAAKCGREEEAKMCLKAAQAGFELGQDAWHAAIVALDLAMVWLRQTGDGEALRILAKVLPHLATFRFEAEGLVALKLLQKAAGEGRANIDLLEQVRRSARRMPSAQLAASSDR
ncbi:MAG: hypothetical protein HC897_15180 [Thermoanaerobaculia bacterium]|nr:hypothetical protein [Thermoanaerobaculia bacterium]